MEYIFIYLLQLSERFECALQASIILLIITTASMFLVLWEERGEENEKLKQQLEIDKNQINYFIEENEKQKEQIKQLEDFIKSDGEIDHINHEYTYKLKKVLQEIKEIVEAEKDSFGNKVYEINSDKILTLIKKAEEE